MSTFKILADSVVSKFADVLDFETATQNTIAMMTQHQTAMLKDQSSKLWDRFYKVVPEDFSMNDLNDRADQMLARRKIAAGQELVKRQRRHAARAEQASFDRMMSAH
jgi:hypothetical protein